MDVPGNFDEEKVHEGVRLILQGVGEDPHREGLLDTPHRVARMYQEIFGGMHEASEDVISAVFYEDYDEIVLLKNIPFFSLCEHHLMPFTGKAHVAYLPDGKIVGLSKLARAVEHFARRPQIQERLTAQIADLISHKLEPKGVAVVLEATHTCMTMRGVKKPGSLMTTSAMRGVMRENLATRNEVLNLIYGKA
ncbi:MAG: GTP cyclohydrolase I FolE [Planctomycetota bacterium]|nr:GTP cyclohydrolase I FolE [Planctomycetota bacterium]